MHILQREVLGRVIAADQIENSIRVSNASLDRWGVSKVVLLEYEVTERLLTISGVIEAYDEDNTAKISGDLEMTLGHLLTEGNNDGASLASQSVDNVSSKLAGCAKYGNGMASEG
jgi:hypothetical protein